MPCKDAAVFPVNTWFNRDKRGFSLVELSIVLVILGLLTGGILAGRSLIRAAELRAISTEYQRFAAAANSFRDQYLSIPGDMNTATRFWGKYSANAWCLSNSGAAITSPGTCDGNGDGELTTAGNANESGERFQFWKQLALAGLIEGTYTGLAGSGGANSGVAGTNNPPSKLTNAGWGANHYNTNGDANNFAQNYGNHFVFGADQAGNYNQTAAILTPEELWGIDTKLDDGKPGTGSVIVIY